MAPVDFDLLPNFIVIGAGKSGTTTLYDIAKQHPSVFVSEEKELDFFSHHHQNGLEWYQNTHFSGASGYPARGEASPSYLGHSVDAAACMKAAYQERPLRLIAILRNPVDRAYSAYWFWKKYAWENLPFEKAIQAEREWFDTHPDEAASFPRRQRNYVYSGRYATLLQPYLECFSRERFQFLLFEDLVADFAGTASQFYEFVGVDPNFKPEHVVKNPSILARNQRLQKSLTDPSDLLRQSVRAALLILPASLRKRWKKGLRKANMVQKKYPPMQESTRHELTAYYREEVEELERITGRDLSRWKV